MSRVLTLILALFTASSAMAQDLPADAPQQIGRVAAISGAVSYQPSADAGTEIASVNYPLTTRNRITTAPRAHATIDLAAGRLYLDGDSAVTIGDLAPGRSSIAVNHGAVLLRILPGGAGQVFEIETRRGVMRADQPGYYEVEATAAGDTVVASALEGGAQFAETHVLPPGTRIVLAEGKTPRIEAAVEDDFIRRVAAEVVDSGESTLDEPSHVSPQATGFQELQHHGIWRSTEQLGWVWEPTVGSGWAPFREGRWVEAAPWGRTWLDYAPWGFTTAHYGRWAKLEGRWVWVPGDASHATARFFGAAESKAGNWVSLGAEEPHPSSSPVIVNNVRVINPAPAPKVVSTTTVNNTTNVTNVVKEERAPGLVIFAAPPRVPPPPQTPTAPAAPRNLTGVGAAGAPMGSGVTFPGN